MHIETSPGEHISRVAARAVEILAARRAKVVRFRFNGTCVVAKQGDAAELVARRFEAERERVSSLPMYVEQRRRWERESERGRIEDQASLDRAIAPLLDGHVNIADPSTAIRWLCSVQDQMDNVGVKFDRAAVIARFEAAGYVAGESCREQEESPEQWRERVGKDGAKRWLIGQAIDGIARVGAPHPSINRLAVEFTD